MLKKYNIIAKDEDDKINFFGNTNILKRVSITEVSNKEVPSFKERIYCLRSDIKDNKLSILGRTL